MSKTCLARFDSNKYSVAANAIGRPVEVHADADRIVIRQDERIVAENPIVRTWRDDLRSLALRAGARPQAWRLAQRAPDKDWVLPAAMEREQRKLAGADDGNRQMVDILTAVLTDGLPAVETACAEAIAQGVHSAEVGINILARQRDLGPPATILTAAALTLRHARSPIVPLRQPQEKHLMERTQLFDLMGELKLYGMKDAFDEMMDTAVKRQHEPQRIVGDLLKAEISEKQARSIKYQLTIAKLRLPRTSTTSSSRARRSMRRS